MGKRLSKNFWLSEFTNKGWLDLNPQEKLMLMNLTNEILQPLRDFLGEINITSGIRDIKDHHRIIAKGYSPSETSDHFFGYPVILRSSKKIKRFGKRYTCSVGASDIIPSLIDYSVYEAFEKTVDFLCNKDINFGQIIYERHGTREWMHISNPPTLIYSSDFIEKFLKRPKVMKSLNGGRTYQIVNV